MSENSMVWSKSKEINRTLLPVETICPLYSSNQSIKTTYEKQMSRLLLFKPQKKDVQASEIRSW